MVACSIGFQVCQGRRRPPTSPGNPRPVGLPNPALLIIVHMSSDGKPSAILVAPIFDDFWITCANVSAPCGCASLIVALPIVILPGAQLMIESNLYLPRSSANAAMKGFMVEPGSKLSVTARLRSWPPESCERLFGLYVGQLASARISPDLTSATMTLPPLALYFSAAFRSALKAMNWI